MAGPGGGGGARRLGDGCARPTRVGAHPSAHEVRHQLVCAQHRVPAQRVEPGLEGGGAGSHDVGEGGEQRLGRQRGQHRGGARRLAVHGQPVLELDKLGVAAAALDGRDCVPVAGAVRVQAQPVRGGAIIGLGLAHGGGPVLSCPGAVVARHGALSTQPCDRVARKIGNRASPLDRHETPAARTAGLALLA